VTISRFDPADLERLIAEEVGSEDFLTDYLDGVARTLDAQPETYRGFGPYWWPLKRLLIDAGHSQFGDTVDDAETADALTYDRPALTAAAAYTFAEHARGAGMQFSPAHTIAREDGELDTYLIADEDIEGPVIARQLVQQGGTDGAD